MSEHPAEPNSAQSSIESKGAEPDAAVPSAAGAPVPASSPSEVEPPKLASEQGGEAPKDAPKPDAPRPASNITIIAPSRGESWDRAGLHDDATAGKGAKASGLFGKRSLSALAAVIAFAALAGAIGGALATAGIGYLRGDGGSSTIQAKLFDDQMARISSELAALKTDVEHTAKLSVTQIAKTTDRLDKVEKAQAEPAAKIAKLSEAVEKLRAAPSPAAAAAATPAVAKEVTGSIAAPAATTASASAKPDVSRLPTVDGWILRDVAGGGAVIEGRQGIFEVYAGDPVPGLGRVDAIRRQDGRWVVVTSRGLIVAR